MTKFLKSGVLLVFATLLVIGCEKDPDESQNYQHDFVGRWTVVEKDGLNSPQNYTVEIVAGNDLNEIIINGFYNAPNTAVKANLYGLSLEIPTQTTDSITFSGSGQATVDFDQITISFTANDGTGEDNVKAILTQP